MMLVPAFAMAMASPTFYESMQAYLDCVQRGLPAGFSEQDRVARTRIYRAAASRCQAEREAAADAAVRQRPEGQSAEEARRLANQIVDDLDPGES